MGTVVIPTNHKLALWFVGITTNHKASLWFVGITSSPWPPPPITGSQITWGNSLLETREAVKAHKTPSLAEEQSLFEDPHLEEDFTHLSKTEVGTQLILWNFSSFTITMFSRGDLRVAVKVVLYRDTVLVEPGSRPFFGSGSVSKDTFMGLDRCRGLKRYILLILTILFMCQPTLRLARYWSRKTWVSSTTLLGGIPVPYVISRCIITHNSM